MRRDTHENGRNRLPLEELDDEPVSFLALSGPCRGHHGLSVRPCGFMIKMK